MPELPDLEIYKENLKPKIINKKVTNALVLKPRVLKSLTANAFKKKLVGQKIEALGRRGKFLIFSLSSKEKLIVHLMLYGQMEWLKPSQEISKDVCAVISFFQNNLCFVDGTGWLKMTFEEKEIANLGIEPLSPKFQPDVLQEIIKKKQLGSIKERLVDQKYVVGIGNAYVDEILWEAEILPIRVASLLNSKEIQTLYQAIQKVLKNSIKEVRKRLKGKINGEPRDFLAIHRKKICPRCGAKVKRIELNKKGTYFCPHCQK